MKQYIEKETKHQLNSIESEYKMKMMELKKEQLKQVLPVRLQAYERILMLLERISADNLVMRHRNHQVTAVAMQALLLKSIREEFDHNISQQLYISSESWSMVKNAKEEMVQLINTVAASIKEEERGIDFCRKVLEYSAKEQRYPTLSAIEVVKKEVRQLF
jgi:hypothetical protein